MNRIADQTQGRFEVAVGSLEGIGITRERLSEEPTMFRVQQNASGPASQRPATKAGSRRGDPALPEAEEGRQGAEDEGDGQ